MGSRASAFIRVVVTAVLASISWVVLGFLVTAPLGAFYGWSGHPAIPAAPGGIYFLVYLIVLPALCLGVSWRLTRRITR
jgi:hypothetical protein